METSEAILRAARVIDLHHHFLPIEHMAEENERLGKAHALPTDQLLSWTPERALDIMDRNGVDYAVGSIPAPGVWRGNAAEAGGLARRWNEFAATQAQRWPTRLGFFATVTPPAPDHALREIAYACDDLGAKGIALFTNYDGLYPGDVAFAPVLDELNRRKAIVFVHPRPAPGSAEVIPGVLPQVIEFAFDSTRAVVSLLVSGSLRRFPDIRWIFTHAGGATPMLAGRLEHTLAGRDPWRAHMPEGAGAELRKLRFDIAGTTAPGAISALRHMVGADRILYGSDAPFVRAETGLRELTARGFSEDDVTAILSRNAAALLASA